MTTVNNVWQSILKGISSIIPRGLTDTVENAVDFTFIRILGLPFIVLGYRQTGKTTLIEWLKRDTSFILDFDPDPTAAGGDAVPAFATQVGADRMKLKPRRDVGGEYAMWETDWLELFVESRPRGIIFMIDHTNVYQHKDALNFVMQMIDEEPQAARKLKTIMLLVNKSDLWSGDTTLSEVLDDYRNEVRRIKSQSERVGYRYIIASSSLLLGEGIQEAMDEFFNSIRPKSRPVAED